MDDAKQKKRVGVAECAMLRKEKDRIGPMHRARKDVTPMLDQCERKVAVLVITKCRVEARKQPPAKHQRKTRREQCRRDPMAGIGERFTHDRALGAHPSERVPGSTICNNVTDLILRRPRTEVGLARLRQP